MASGFAVLLITAVAPIALFQGIKFAHGTAGKVTRDLGGMAIGMTPFGALARVLPLAGIPGATRARTRVSNLVKPSLNQIRAHFRPRP